MIVPKQAMEAAIAHLGELYKTSDFYDVRLEEIELTEDEKEWLVTIGFNRLLPEPPSAFQTAAGATDLMQKLIGGGKYKREYKVFRVDSETGKVRSMKNREL